MPGRDKSNLHDVDIDREQKKREQKRRESFNARIQAKKSPVTIVEPSPRPLTAYSYRWSGLTAVAGPGRRIALMCEDRVQKYVRLPLDLEVHVFDLTVKIAKHLTRAMENGTADYVIVAAKSPSHDILIGIAKNLRPVYVWTRNINSLGDEIHALLGLPKYATQLLGSTAPSTDRMNVSKDNDGRFTVPDLVELFDCSETDIETCHTRLFGKTKTDRRYSSEEATKIECLLAPAPAPAPAPAVRMLEVEDEDDDLMSVEEFLRETEGEVSYA